MKISMFYSITHGNGGLICVRDTHREFVGGSYGLHWIPQTWGELAPVLLRGIVLIMKTSLRFVAHFSQSESHNMLATEKLALLEWKDIYVLRFGRKQNNSLPFPYISGRTGLSSFFGLHFLVKLILGFGFFHVKFIEMRSHLIILVCLFFDCLNIINRAFYVRM